MYREELYMHRLNAPCCFRHGLESQHLGSWRAGASDPSISGRYFNLKFKSEAQASFLQIVFSHSHPFLGWWKLPWLRGCKMSLLWFLYFLNSLHPICQENLFYWGKKNLEINGSPHLCNYPGSASPIYQDHCNGLLAYPQLLFLFLNLFSAQSPKAYKSNLVILLLQGKSTVDMSIRAEAEVLITALFQSHRPSSFSSNTLSTPAWCYRFSC